MEIRVFRLPLAACAQGGRRHCGDPAAVFHRTIASGPYDIGARLSAAGFFPSKVRKTAPRGHHSHRKSELICHEDISNGDRSLGEGRIVEYNAQVLAGPGAENATAIPLLHDIVSPIQRNDIQEGVGALNVSASEADVVIINAGSSAGSKDFTVHAIREIGEVLVHGVAMMPGKPTILGIVEGKAGDWEPRLCGFRGAIL